MEEYVATFFSHFGAIRFGRALRLMGIEHVLTPVPRQLSSSCGTCVRFKASSLPELPKEDLERLFRVNGEAYTETLSLI